MTDAAATFWTDCRRLSRLALMAGGLGLVLAAPGYFVDPGQFFRSYLLAYLFWIALPIGSLGILLIHALTGGRWGLALQRVLEAAAETIILMALLFIPVALGMHELYIWTHADVVAADKVLKAKAPFLNEGFFLLRAAVYFAIWAVVAFFMIHWSGTRDDAHDSVRARTRQTFAGPAVLFVSLAVTFAAIDWIMSLEPHWFSSIFGALVAASQMLPALAFGIVLLAWLAPRSPLGKVLDAGLWNDLGNLLLAFIMIWAYLSYSQFFLIWAGGLTEEITWYRPRMQGGWEILGWGLILFYFALPFVLLFSRAVKRDPNKLAMVAGLVVFMHLVFQYWLIVPSFGGHGDASPTESTQPNHAGFHWIDVPCLVGIGGLWLGWFFWRLPARSLVPSDPELQEAPHHA